MAWNLDGSRPIYLQLVEEIRRRIVTGEYPPGSHIPSVRDFATQASVNPNTMQRALTELERTQLIENQRTNGRTVTEDAAMIEKERRTIAEEELKACLVRMQKIGISPEELIEMIRKSGKEKEN